MKKIIMVSLMAMMTVMSVNAQNNTFTMVIEMQNGTKVTIGPNEVKSVTFNNGEVIFSGVTLENLINQKLENVDGVGTLLTPLNNKINIAYDDIMKLQGEIVNLKTADANLQAAIDKLEGALKEANATLKSQGETLVGMAAADGALERGITEAKAQASNALYEAKKVQEAATTNAANLKSTDATLAALQKTVSDNRTTVRNMIDSEISKLDSRIWTNETNIAKLQEKASTAEANVTTVNYKLSELSAKDDEIVKSMNSAITEISATLKELSDKIKELSGK